MSLGTQAEIVATTQERVKDLARVIQIGVQELTAVRDTDRDRLHHYVDNLHTQGLEVSIASSENLILNSSNPQLIGAALRPEAGRMAGARATEASRCAADYSGGQARAGAGDDGLPDPGRGRGPSAGLRAGGGEFRRLREAAGGEPDARADDRVCDFRDWAGIRVYPGRPLREADPCGRERGAEFRGARPGAGAGSASTRRDRIADAQLQRDGRAVEARARSASRS